MREHSHGLDLLRAGAITGVMLYHGWQMGFGSPCPRLAAWGWMGVDLFFVLSGFLIGNQLFKEYAKGRKPSTGGFYARRAFRILPAYLTVVGVYFLFEGARETHPIQPLWQFLTFTENLFIDSTNRAFSHVWSLCVEEHFYLLFPLLVGFLMLKPSRNRALACFAFVLLAGICLRAWAWLHYFESAYKEGAGVTKPGYFYFDHVYYPTFMRLDGLLAGVALASVRSFRPGRWQVWCTRWWIPAIIGAVGALVALLLLRHQFAFWPTVLGYPILSFSLAMFVLAVSGAEGGGRMPVVPGAALIARISFSLYLTHKIAFHLAQKNLPSIASSHGLLEFVFYSMTALVCGSALYLFVEWPFLRLRELIASRGKIRASEGGATIMPPSAAGSLSPPRA